MSKREIQKERTRSNIIVAAKNLYLSKSIGSVTTQEIAEAAHVAKGSVFHHFENKKELIKAVMQDVIDELMSGTKQLVEVIKINPNMFDTIFKDMLKEMLENEIDNPGPTKFLLDFLMIYNDGVDTSINEMMTEFGKYIDVFSEILSLIGIKNPEIKSRILFASLDGIVLQMQYLPFENPNEYISSIVDEIMKILIFWRQD